ncbi:MAG: hypothetical protein ACR2RV_06320, partial [Verrucomicrobiales bacterium]
RGEKGDKDDNPEDYLKFKDGVLVTDSFDEQHDTSAEKIAEPVPQEWVNAEGKKITATFRGFDGDQVTLELENGKTVKYPIRKLSEKSREELEKLRAGSE